MQGQSILELLVVLVISLVLAGGLVFTLSGREAVNPRECVGRLEELLSHARARSAAGKLESRIEFRTSSNEAVPTWREPALRLPLSCRIQSAVFGLEGEREPSLVFYPSGNASPGHLLISGSDSACRLTQTLRGARNLRCAP